MATALRPAAIAAAFAKHLNGSAPAGFSVTVNGQPVSEEASLAAGASIVRRNAPLAAIYLPLMLAAADIRVANAGYPCTIYPLACRMRL